MTSWGWRSTLLLPLTNWTRGSSREDPSLADNRLTVAPATTNGGTTSDASWPPQTWPTTKLLQKKRGKNDQMGPERISSIQTSRLWMPGCGLEYQLSISSVPLYFSAKLFCLPAEWMCKYFSLFFFFFFYVKIFIFLHTGCVAITSFNALRTSAIVTAAPTSTPVSRSRKSRCAKRLLGGGLGLLPVTRTLSNSGMEETEIRVVGETLWKLLSLSRIVKRELMEKITNNALPGIPAHYDSFRVFAP